MKSDAGRSAYDRLVISPALPSDARDLWLWRNDPVTRAMSLDPNEIVWSEHQAWYAEALHDPARVIYLGSYRDGGKIGVCRFDLSADAPAAEVSINMNPAFRGHGLSYYLLTKSVDDFVIKKPVPLIARIRPSNVPSIRCFARAGFSLAGRCSDYLIFRREP